MSMANTRKALPRSVRSERFLLSNYIKTDPGKPEIANEEDIVLKQPGSVVARAVCALMASSIASNICDGGSGRKTARACIGIIDKFGLRNELTADEKRYFALADKDAPAIPDGEAEQFGWRAEMCMPLFWACGFLGERDLEFPSHESDTSEIIKLLGGCESFSEVMSMVKMHTAAEILDNADVCMRMDMACAKARKRNDRSISGTLMDRVVYEQHKGFEWLLGISDTDDWDSIRPSI